MSLKEFEQEGEKEIEEILIDWEGKTNPIMGALRVSTRKQTILGWHNKQMDKAYELGKQETLKEYADTKLYQWIKGKNKDWEKKTLDEVYQIIRQQAIEETLAMVLKEIEGIEPDSSEINYEEDNFASGKREALYTLKQRILQAKQ